MTSLQKKNVNEIELYQTNLFTFKVITKIVRIMQCVYVCVYVCVCVYMCAEEKVSLDILVFVL